MWHMRIFQNFMFFFVVHWTNNNKNVLIYMYTRNAKCRDMTSKGQQEKNTGRKGEWWHQYKIKFQSGKIHCTSEGTCPSDVARVMFSSWLGRWWEDLLPMLMCWNLDWYFTPETSYHYHRTPLVLLLLFLHILPGSCKILFHYSFIVDNSSIELVSYTTGNCYHKKY